jgi:hypothetical protein
VPNKKSEVKTVHVKPETFERLQGYSGLTGVQIRTVVDRALNDWMDTVGVVHMEVLAGKASADRLSKIAKRAVSRAASLAVPSPEPAPEPDQKSGLPEVSA